MTTSTTAVDTAPPSIPLSALEHVDYCQRQAALIHVEAVWTDSVDTVRGDLLHRNVDIPSLGNRRGVTAVRSLPVRSVRLGLHGVCDLVEIRHRQATPVEYKVGPYRPDGPADLQVAGQAACLIEAGFEVTTGYVYSAADRRRHPVSITIELLDAVGRAADTMRAILAQATLPPARNDRRCRRCSLREDCVPELTDGHAAHIDLFIPRPVGNWRD